MTIELLTYKCRSCEQTFMLNAVAHHIQSPLLAQVSFHQCDPELPSLRGVGDLINFVEDDHLPYSAPGGDE